MRISKITILLYFLAFIVAILFLLLLIRGSYRASKTVEPNPTTIQKVETFRITSTNINEESIKVTDNIIINFSHPVDNLSLDLEIYPKTTIVPYFDQPQTTLIIQPSDIWEFGTTYTLVIKSATTSINGQRLDKDHIYNFKTLPIRGD